jgi:phenylalanyl-tRNA synthetase beta chain
MKISYNELQKTYFTGTLPSVENVADALTFHAWEIDGQEQVGGDTVLDVKVLPDKSAWALSHRGVAKDISTILNIPLAQDPLATAPTLLPTAHELLVEVLTPTCTRYTAALIVGVKVGPSPLWLTQFLASMGQRSINNVVDVTNYVMLSTGQPLHAFDAGKLSKDVEGRWHIRVRDAKQEEHITTLTGEEYELASQDALIVDGITDAAVGIAGVKGGKVAEVDEETVDIILESAHFYAQKVRKTSQRLKLRTDASQRFENGISRGVAAYGVAAGAALIVEHCGGTLVGYVDTNPAPVTREPVTLSVANINRVLGLTLSLEDVEAVLKRFGFAYSVVDDTLTVTPPFERPDLTIPQDFIEEIGRVHGYEHVPSIAISPLPLREVSKRFFYAEAVRDALVALGFSEILTSTFREHDVVKLKNALASDKGYLRSGVGMVENMKDALAKNAPMADLFGSEQVRLFEIGTVFEGTGERYVLTLGVSSKQGFVPKKDQKVLDAGMAAVKEVLGVGPITTLASAALCDITLAVETLEGPLAYTPHEFAGDVAYTPFSLYPYLTRDVAFWAQAGTDADTTHGSVVSAAGPLAVRIDMFDRFEKEGRVSYGFRIVFQSHEKTLEGAEADTYMEAVYKTLRERGCEVR